jgi:excisionase family DNA binding protein
MTSQAPEAASGPPLAVLSPTETLLLEVISNLEIELAEARPYVPKRPPPGWQRVQTVAERLGLRPVTIYRMCREGRIASAKIGPCLWIAPIEVRPPRKAYKRRD